MDEFIVLNMEKFYKNIDKREELIDEGLGLAGRTSTGLVPNFLDLTYEPEELSDFFRRVMKRYTSDYDFVSDIIKYVSDSKDFIDVFNLLKMLDGFANSFIILLEHERLSQLLGNDEVSQNIMECMLFYVVLAMEQIEDISFKRE